MARNIRVSDKPKLFSPQVARSATTRAGSVQLQALSKVSNSNLGSTSSFRYDNPGVGLKSTQEIPVDYSQFENHTFFSSAVVKTNVAFDKIINDYPFDGTQEDLEVFEDGLTGWEKHVLSQFPNNTGYLVFSGTQIGEDPSAGFSPGLGTHIVVNNNAGYLFPGTAKENEGRNILDTGDQSFSVEAFLFIPPIANGPQVICQRKGSNSGFNIGLDSSVSATSANLRFSVFDSDQKSSVTFPVRKGSFFQFCATWDASPGEGNAKIFINSSLAVSSSDSSNILQVYAGSSPLVIGSGSTFYDFTPTQTLSGAIEDFRFFKTTRTSNEQLLDLQRSILQKKDMNLYFKFNEPTGSYGLQDIALDSSGNALHSRIVNYTDYLRTEPFGASPLINEDPNKSPILYPSFDAVSSLNGRLLSSASLYDEVNPNLITRLVPPHYFLEGQVSNGFTDLNGPIDNPYSSISIPGTGKLGQTQVMMAFLFVWAKFFDEMKMFIDAFSNLLSVDYDSQNDIPDKLLPFIADYYGFTLPNIFSAASIDQYVKGEGINATDLKAIAPLRDVQNQIWKRILVNLGEITRTKGTRQSLRSIMLAAGVDPDGAFTIREYGGPSKSSLKGLRLNRTEVSAMLDMSGTISITGSNASLATFQTYQGFGQNPRIISQFLTASRIEAGAPGIRSSNFSKGISTKTEDGLLTSGSFTYEAIYSWDRRFKIFATQSLARLEVTGSGNPSLRGGLVANLLATSGSSGSLSLYINPHAQSGGDFKTTSLVLTGVNIFDGDKWNISFGRDNRYEATAPYRQSVPETQYFLRCAKQNFGTIQQFFAATTSSIHESNFGSNASVFSNKSSTYNVSGSIVVIGSQSMYRGGGLFLNSTANIDFTRETLFNGKVGKIRFWSKALSTDEWKEHVRNFKSLGASDPSSNLNFGVAARGGSVNNLTPAVDKNGNRVLTLSQLGGNIATGSFERLRLDADIDQLVTQSSANGSIQLFDYSQSRHVVSTSDGLAYQYYHMTGEGFEPNKRIIKPIEFNYSFISPFFDRSQSDNKVRIRSLNERDDEHPYAQLAPAYDVPLGQYPDDDTRFGIEYSTVAALNEDIMRIFSTLDFFDNALGRQEILFSDGYDDLEQMRKIYFDRLEEKLNLVQFFQVFKWFDSSFSDLFAQLLPRKTKFQGVNFVIESHVLERHKLKYMFDDMYLSDRTRSITAAGTNNASYDADGKSRKF